MLLPRISTLVLFLSLVSISCSDSDADGDDNGHEMGDGGAQGGAIDHCCQLGAICHVVGDEVDADVRACHNLGHENDAAACKAEYDSCLEICEGITDSPMEHACE